MMSTNDTRIDSAAYWMLGLAFDRSTQSDAQRHVLRAARQRTPLVFATPNTSFLRTASRDAVFRGSVLRCDLSLVDGMPLVWLGRILGIPFKERVAGSSLIEQLAAISNGEQVTVYFFGGAGTVGDAACKVLNTSTTGLRAAGAMNPGFGTIEEMSAPEILERINAAEADFLIVALGARKGHLWIDRNRSNLRAPVISHLGATVNFLAGTIHRAPGWMHNLGLEWLWRIGQEPSLIKRYAADAYFLTHELATAVMPLMAWKVIRRYIGIDRSLSISTGTTDTGDGALILAGSLVADNVPNLRDAVDRLADKDGSRPISIDLNGIEDIDCRGLGFLYELRYRSRGSQITIHGINGRLRRLLNWHRAMPLVTESDSHLARR